MKWIPHEKFPMQIDGLISNGIFSLESQLLLSDVYEKWYLFIDVLYSDKNLYLHCFSGSIHSARTLPSTTSINYFSRLRVVLLHDDETKYQWNLCLHPPWSSLHRTSSVWVVKIRSNLVLGNLQFFIQICMHCSSFGHWWLP